jgi:hypothetical protein
MSAQSTQKENKGSATQSGTQSSSSSGERTQQGLARRSAIPDVPSLLLDPFGFFDNGLSIFRRLFDMNRGFGQTELSRSGQRSGKIS